MVLYKRILLYKQGVDAELARAEKAKKEAQERVRELKRRFIKTITKREAEIEVAFESTQRRFTPRQRQIQRLEVSAQILELSDSENRHLERIVHGGTKSYFEPVKCRVIPDSKYDPHFMAEPALTEDEVYNRLWELRSEFRKLFDERWSKGFSFRIEDPENKFASEESWRGGNGKTYVSVQRAIDFVCHYYLAAMETRTMTEYEYTKLGVGMHPLQNLLEKIKVISQSVDKELDNLHASAQKDKNGHRHYNLEMHLARDNLRKAPERLVGQAALSFLGYFAKFHHGKTPYQRVRAMKERIEPIAYRLL